VDSIKASLGFLEFNHFLKHKFISWRSSSIMYILGSVRENASTVPFVISYCCSQYLTVRAFSH